MAHGIVDLVIVVDDASQDGTVAIARTLDRVQVEVHPENRGYGANQKTCYRLALAAGADIIVMIHPDYQYTPQLIPAMAALVASGLFIPAAWFAHPRWWRAARWHALVEIHLEPVSYPRGEPSPWREALGISHRLSRFCAQPAGTATAGGELR